MNILITNYLLNLTTTLNSKGWGPESDYISMNIFDSFCYKLKEISTYGFTIEEFQRAILILCFIRFPIVHAFPYVI